MQGRAHGLHTEKKLGSGSFWLWGGSAKHCPSTPEVVHLEKLPWTKTGPNHLCVSMNYGYCCYCGINSFMNKIRIIHTKSHSLLIKHKIHRDVSQISLTHLLTFMIPMSEQTLKLREGVKAPWSPWLVKNEKRCKNIWFSNLKRKIMKRHKHQKRTITRRNWKARLCCHLLT